MGKGGKYAGRVVGRYFLDDGGKYDFMQEKVKDDFRHGAEFIAKVRPFYLLELLQKIHYITFFKILKECEEEMRERLKKSKEKN